MEKIYERSDNTPQYRAFVQKERGQKIPEKSPMYYTGEAFTVPDKSKNHPQDMWGHTYYVIGVGDSPVPPQVRYRLAWEKQRRKRQAEQEVEAPTHVTYPEIDLKDWTTSGHLKVAKFILNKDQEYLKKMVSTFANKKDIDRLYRHQEQSTRLQDVKGVDQDDDFASYWLPKLRKAYYIMRSPKSDGKTEAVSIIQSARDSLSIPNPNLI